MKIWEVHAISANGAIRTTADGDANIAGLVFSEKAYLLAMRDFRPLQLVRLVQEQGPHAAAEALISHFVSGQPEATGRSLAHGRSRLGDPLIQRSDEVPEAIAPGRAGLARH